jgi:hypothetical protein
LFRRLFGGAIRVGWRLNQRTGGSQAGPRAARTMAGGRRSSGVMNRPLDLTPQAGGLVGAQHGQRHGQDQAGQDRRGGGQQVGGEPEGHGQHQPVTLIQPMAREGLLAGDLVGVAALGGPAADLAGQDLDQGAGLGEHQHRGDQRRQQHLDAQAGHDPAAAAEALDLVCARRPGSSPGSWGRTAARR